MQQSGPARKITAVGTMGEAGQLFTVYEKNWNCLQCSQENFATRKRCFRCKGKKPNAERQDNYIPNPALEAIKSGVEIQWQEAIDPNSYQIYYYNKGTGATQWERPEELGPAPLATGWFGRGNAGSISAKIYSDANTRFLSRPARKQKEFIDPKKYHTEGAQEYNIWYGKYISDSYDKGSNKEKAPDRCVLELDAGFTRADGILEGSSKKANRHFFCLHFARGMCAKGAECKFYHRVPTPEDDAACDELFDCFGRPRHSKHKDDMSGTGSFMKPCRTLFVGNLLKQKYGVGKELEDCIWRHFSEWGELESINVIYRLSICFPRYRLRTSAEFAKEAMGNQSLDHGEILMIRWAHDDPNPVAQDSIERADRDALAALMRAKGIRVDNAAFEYPAGYDLPEAKRMRLEDGDTVDASIEYPNTDEQYSEVNTAADATAANEAEYAKYYQQYVEPPLPSSTVSTITTTADTSTATNVPSDTGTGTGSESTLASGWEAHVDDDTGATYYYNETTGQSTWTLPQ